ncbi:MULTISPECIES: DMT family transporter [Roseobacteraceae]|uniref:Riboflavin transporter n=1 Tax=Pseudosulfitobacter pseudonitzschiae TaxID=1402135 RepID=A0A221K5E6_9RHOB|nr:MULTISPECIES: DMT family transporter [Roseobacteraceae]ASM74067.1 riboflavin transporter [Pseudosulfitobacter pseudonitzschiae]
MKRATDKTGHAIVLSLIALTLFDGMGLIIKLLSDHYSAAELSAWRNIFGLIPALIALATSRAWHASGRSLKIRQWKLALGRGAIVTMAQLFFYLSLGRMEFATASTITYANALFMTALAVPLLGEVVGWVRWSAVMIGFVGVVLVMQPGSDTFSTDALYPLGAALMYALVAVTARMFDEEVPSPLVSFYSNTTAVVGSIVLALALGGFSAVAKADILWLMAMGAFGGTAVLIIVVSQRMTEQANLAPFSYFGIPFAFLLGWLFFNETPWDALFPGAILIAAGGLLIVWREGREVV